MLQRPPTEEVGARERPKKRLRSAAPAGALAIAHQLKAGSAHEQATAAEALLEDDQQLFPQKRARLLQWVVDALIRSQKQSCAAAAAKEASSAEPVHSALHWRLLAQLIPGNDAPVHADLACAVMAAANGCASDGLLQPAEDQLLQHILSALMDLRPLYFRPRVEALRDVLSSLCALATRVTVPALPATTVVLQLCTLAARRLTTALRQSSNMKRNFTLVNDILPRLISLRGSVVDVSGVAESQSGTPELLTALDALLSAAMFRPEQLSDYHLAFTAKGGQAAAAAPKRMKGGHGLASYQSQLFKTLRTLVLADKQNVQVAACAAVSWVFVCFVSAMHGETEDEPAQKASGDTVTGPGVQHGTAPHVGKRLRTKTISPKAGFDCFVECHRILELLATSRIHTLRAAALRSSNRLLATLESSEIYRRTVDENAGAHSRSAVHATLREIWRAVKLGSEAYSQAAMEPDLWYANGAVAQCTTALIKLDHHSIDTELVAVWSMLERMRDGQLLEPQSCEKQNLWSPARHSAAELAIAHFDACCTELTHQIVGTYGQLYQILPLLESLLLAIRKGLVKSDTLVACDLCSALRTASPMLPSSQLPQIFASFRLHLAPCVKNVRDEPTEQDTDPSTVDAIVAMFVIILQYCSVDEASSTAIYSELELLNSEILGPVLHPEQSRALRPGCEQVVAHLRRGAVALEFRLRFQNASNELQSIPPVSVLGTWESILTPEQQRMTDHCDLAATCVALQRIAVLHDSVHSCDAKSESSLSAQISECLAYVWRDIDEMQQQSAEGVMQSKNRAKWQQIAANIFLLSKCSSTNMMEKFYASVVALLSRENTQDVDADCLATAKNLVQDHRFYELESFRQVGLAVVTNRIRQLSSNLGVKPWVTTLLTSVGSLANATESSDRSLINHLNTRVAHLNTNAKQMCEDQGVLVSSMSGIASVMKFVRSLPPGFFDIKHVLQCVRLSCAVEDFCGPGASAQGNDRSRRSAWVEARCLLGWSLALVCSNRHGSTREVQAAVPLIDAACSRFLEWPPAVAAEDWSCQYISHYRDAVVTFMGSIATGHSRHESDTIQKLLPSAFHIESVEAESCWWPTLYLTAFLNQASRVIEARLRVTMDSLIRDKVSAASIARPLQLPASLLACVAALEHCTSLKPQGETATGSSNRRSCTFLRAMAALLDARRIIAANGSVYKAGELLGSELSESVTTAVKLLASNELNQDMRQSCLEVIGATVRALQLFEPQLSARDLGCLLAVVFRVHSQSLLTHSTQSSALGVFKGIVVGACTDHVELLLLTVQSELATCNAGDTDDMLLRAWTAIEALRVTEEAIRSDSPRHKRLLQTHAAGLTQALLRQIHKLQYMRTPDDDDAVALIELPWHAVVNAATRNLARLVHYTATSGMREARQTMCLLQVAERMCTAVSDCEVQVILVGASAVLELLTEIVKMCARDVIQCMPIFISCTRKILTLVWSLSLCSHESTQPEPLHKKGWESTAAQLCSLYELLPKALNVSALRRYASYLLSNYIDAALRHGDQHTLPTPSPFCIMAQFNHADCVSCGYPLYICCCLCCLILLAAARSSNRRARLGRASRDQVPSSMRPTTAASVEVRSALLRGVYTLIGVCSSHELRQLHTVRCQI